MSPRPKGKLLLLFFAVAVALGLAPLPAINGVSDSSIAEADDLDAIAAEIAADIAAEQGGAAEQYLGYAKRLAKTLTSLPSEKQERVLRDKAFKVRGNGNRQNAGGEAGGGNGNTDGSSGNSGNSNGNSGNSNGGGAAANPNTP